MQDVLHLLLRCRKVFPGRHGNEGAISQEFLTYPICAAHNGLNLEVNDTALDPDRDGLTNLLEYQIGTRANVFDTDGDGLPDGFEYRYRSRLRSAVWDDKNLDPDGDGITDKWEAFYGFDPTAADGGADPDGDRLSSGEEIAGGSSPVDADIDADGLNDKQEREQGTSPGEWWQPT